MQSEQRTHTKNFRHVTKIAGIIAGVVLVFAIGVGVGNGSITFGSDSTQKQNANLPEHLDYTSVEQVYDALRASYDGKLDTQKLLDGMKDGLARATGDAYTEYFDPKQAEEFDKQLNGSFSGIGAELGEEEGNLIIVSPIAGFPAEKAGLRPKDVIVSIDGKNTQGMSVDEAVSLIRGPKDTKVTLRIFRDKREDLSITITRADITIPSAKWEILDGNIGYLQISQFNDETYPLAQQAAREFKDKDVRGVVLDLRGNPGGLLNSAIDVSSLWLPRGKAVLEERRGGVAVETYRANGGNMLAGMRTVALINEGSASASEIVAGALKDNNAATLYGVKSYGKGSVQEIRNLPGGGELKVTVARWFRPNGQNIDQKGISPDKTIELTDEDYAQGRDPQKDAALELLRK